MYMGMEYIMVEIAIIVIVGIFIWCCLKTSGNDK